MGDIVNLNRARKARDRVASKAEAATNRVAHGLTRGQRETARADRERQARLLDQSKRETPPTED